MTERARCPKCNLNVRIKSTRYDTRVRKYVVGKFFGDHFPGGRSWKWSSHCEFSSKEYDAASQP